MGPYDRAMSRVTPLRDDRPGLPAPCATCVFWQDRHRASDRARKERWAESMRERDGAWGLVLWDGDRFEGLVQYGPARSFPRANVLPSGPPSRDAALVTCIFLSEEDPIGVSERLLLEALADLQARGVDAVEAFGVDEPDVAPGAGHRTLLDIDLLERLGFARVRATPPVALMRLELGGLEPSRSHIGISARLQRLVRPPAVRPASSK